MPKPLALLAAVLLLAGCSAAQWMNSLTPHRGRAFPDIVYAEDTGLALDVYVPHVKGPLPVIVFFFPGRWMFGERADFRFVAEGILARGFVAVIPTYRHYPGARYPDFLYDSAQAVAWTRRNIDRYGGDRDNIFLMGHSSGAYNAAMITFDDQYLQSAGETPDWIRGVIGLAGPYDFPVDALPEIKAIFGHAPPGRSQPIDFVDGDEPPLLLLHGEDDLSVDVANSRSLARKVSSLGGSVETVIYERLDHGYIVASLSPSVRFRDNPWDFIESFVRRHASHVGVAGKG
ncbi:MAG TPA: alpha/beta hydrolase [Candidatus Binatia bacterium]|nr:alpha/beta hydrolase [Candidatus Binatia bacterium]